MPHLALAGQSPIKQQTLAKGIAEARGMWRSARRPDVDQAAMCAFATGPSGSKAGVNSDAVESLYAAGTGMMPPMADREKLARAWIASTASLDPERGSVAIEDYAELPEEADWAVDQLSDAAQDDPEEAYQTILSIVSMTRDPWILTNVAAGPLETILKSNACEFVPRMTRDAATYPALRALPEHVWISDMPEALRRELDALSGIHQS